MGSLPKMAAAGLVWTRNREYHSFRTCGPLVLARRRPQGINPRKGGLRMSSVFTQEQGLGPPRRPERPPLRFRPLDPVVDPALFSTVTFGPEPYKVEVQDFLRGEAVVLEEHGVCATTVALLPHDDRVVGFYSTRGIKIQVDEAFREEYGISKTKARKLPPEFDVCYLIGWGVNEPFQGKGYAPEIHDHLVDALTSGAMRPPYMFLKVWQLNDRAAWLYDDWGYKTIGYEEADLYGITQTRLKMVLKLRD